MIQKLQGIKITPRGSTNRFAFQNWPNSYAFGGWIYSASTSIGFNNNPSEIKISVVLETSTFDQSAAKFDINKNDLKCDAGAGGLDNETWFDIELEGIEFKNFLLYEYDFSIEVNQKILNVTFKDYSIILDKIYVGLFKKQGYYNRYVESSPCVVQFPIQCQDCAYDGTSYIEAIGEAERDISFASYIGTNGKVLNNFLGVTYSRNKNVYDHWDSLIRNSPNPGDSNNGKFDLNGGYLIIGTESVSEQRCNSAPNITYSFIELLASLRKAGLNFIGAFPNSISDSDYYYRANYIGTLRDVLQNWCSDLGYSFYCKGRSFVGINLKSPIDISKITQISDPTSELGSNFSINSPYGNSAILSFKSSASLGNTFRQSVIVENSHPITEVTNQKNLKRYIRMTPLHPISLNLYDSSLVNDVNINGIPFQRPRYETEWFDDAKINQNKNISFNMLDGRSYSDLDTAIALSNYNSTLRDIFVAQKALGNVDTFARSGISSSGLEFAVLKNPYCMANFNALGMNPIMEIIDPQHKSDILVDFFSNGEKNDLSNLNMDSRYFRVFLGYYNEEIKEETVDWERKSADAMYKYGVVTNGNLIKEPYVAPDVLNDLSPEEGFYGENGLWYTSIKNDFNPSAERYSSIIATPFVDVLLYSGLVRSSSQGEYPEGNPDYPPYVPPGYSVSSKRIPTGLWIAQLDNEWGTSVQDFNKQLSMSFDDVCASQYSLDDSVSQIFTNSDRQIQDWKLEYFRPIASPNLDKIADIVEQLNSSGATSGIFDKTLDFVVNTYFDIHLIEKKECKKLHVIIIPDTRRHPNLNISFRQNPRNKINGKVLEKFKQKVFNAEIQKKNTRTPSICSLSIAQEMCENALTGGVITSTNGEQITLDPNRLGCSVYENKNNYFIEGFLEETLFNINSRSLTINISKNPPNLNRSGAPTYDVQGDFYLADLSGGLEISSNQTNLEIVYPIQCGNDGFGNYLNILSTEVETDVRLPAMVEIYGSPVNSTYNNVSSIKVINNPTDNSLNPQLNSTENKVVSYMTVIKGGGRGNIISTPGEYYNLISNLNTYNLYEPMKTVEMTLAGTPNQFGLFKNFIDPSFGLNQFSISIGDNGVKTTLSFSDRPPILPKQETILNSVGPRIKGTYN